MNAVWHGVEAGAGPGLLRSRRQPGRKRERAYGLPAAGEAAGGPLASHGRAQRDRGGSKSTTPTGGTGGDVAGGGAGGDTPGGGGSADPALAARKAFNNPGGMWTPAQMAHPQHAAQLKAMGVAIPAENLTNPLAEPLNAVVSLGGCTGSFVSPEGLTVTNHHCVQAALQFNSTPDNDLVENGFRAARSSRRR